VARGLGFERNNGQLLPHNAIDERALACSTKSRWRSQQLSLIQVNTNGSEAVQSGG
jgi:hypothetical protein